MRCHLITLERLVCCHLTTNQLTTSYCLFICHSLLPFRSPQIHLVERAKGRVTRTRVNSLGLAVTNTLGYLAKLLIFFLLLCNQVEGTSFQPISLTKLNLSTIKPISMSNPNSPIRPMNNPRTAPPQGPTAQPRAQFFGPPPFVFTRTYMNQPYGRTRRLNGPHTPVFFPPPTSAPGSSYTIDGVVYNTRATKKIKSGSDIRYSKIFRANLADKVKLEFYETN